MRYNLYVNQVRALELNIKNITQAHIFDYLIYSHKWAKKEIIDNETFYWVSRKKIADELKILNLKPDTIYRHLKSLHKNNLIIYKKVGKKDCIRITKKGERYLNKSTHMSEKNPTKFGKKFENYSEKNSIDNTTIIYNKNNINNRDVDKYIKNIFYRLKETFSSIKNPDLKIEFDKFKEPDGTPIFDKNMLNILKNAGDWQYLYEKSFEPQHVLINILIDAYTYNS